MYSSVNGSRLDYFKRKKKIMPLKRYSKVERIPISLCDFPVDAQKFATQP